MAGDDNSFAYLTDLFNVVYSFYKSCQEGRR